MPAICLERSDMEINQLQGEKFPESHLHRLPKITHWKRIRNAEKAQNFRLHRGPVPGSLMTPNCGPEPSAGATGPIDGRSCRA